MANFAFSSSTCPSLPSLFQVCLRRAIEFTAAALVHGFPSLVMRSDTHMNEHYRPPSYLSCKVQCTRCKHTCLTHPCTYKKPFSLWSWCHSFYQTPCWSKHPWGRLTAQQPSSLSLLTAVPWHTVFLGQAVSPSSPSRTALSVFHRLLSGGLSLFLLGTAGFYESFLSCVPGPKKGVGGGRWPGGSSKQQSTWRSSTAKADWCGLKSYHT